MHGLYLFWWVQEKQLSPALVAAMLAAGDLVLIGLELPTGWFADRFGHRASLVLGSFVQVLGMVWCWLGEGVPGLLTASVLVALGDAFRSGAHQALLYRTCLALDREHDFQRIEAKTEAIALFALVGLVLMGGVIVHAGGFAMGWLAEILLCSAGLAIACLMVEPPPQPNGTIEPRAAKDRTTIPYKRLATLIMPAALLGGAASAASFLAQTVGTCSPAHVTVFVAGLTAAEAGGSALASRLPIANLRDQVKVSALGAFLLMTALAWPPSLPVAAVILGFLLGIAQPLRAAAIQRLATDTIRARAASAASACDMIVSVLMLPLAGFWRGRRT